MTNIILCDIICSFLLSYVCTSEIHYIAAASIAATESTIQNNDNTYYLQYTYYNIFHDLLRYINTDTIFVL